MPILHTHRKASLALLHHLIAHLVESDRIYRMESCEVASCHKKILFILSILS